MPIKELSRFPSFTVATTVLLSSSCRPAHRFFHRGLTTCLSSTTPLETARCRRSRRSSRFSKRLLSGRLPTAEAVVSRVFIDLGSRRDVVGRVDELIDGPRVVDDGLAQVNQLGRH